MTQTNLTPIRFENAIWEGHLASEDTPEIEVRYRDQTLPDVELVEAEGGWTLRVPVPSSLLSEGVHSVVIWDQRSNHKLGDFTVISGSPVAEDMRAELSLLRAELDMLKRAFRRLHGENNP
ncbi:hypothetical protein [Ruegeria arenilitoris]|uniref:hypothetical protein n=1 Tax=Ruegeria arenilitoris TaxID=1173585 RepID=UPI00147FA3E5|nr:hypothetical protein [Ruegeria arenilitoris]